MSKKQILEKIEQAYREGIRTGIENPDYKGLFLVTSQIRAFEIYTGKKLTHANN